MDENYDPPSHLQLANSQLSTIIWLQHFDLQNTNSLGHYYLEIPITEKIIKKEDRTFIIGKLHSKLANWKGKLLSKAGRTCLRTGSDLGGGPPPTLNFWKKKSSRSDAVHLLLEKVGVFSSFFNWFSSRSGLSELIRHFGIFPTPLGGESW